MRVRKIGDGAEHDIRGYRSVCRVELGSDYRDRNCVRVSWDPDMPLTRVLGEVDKTMKTIGADEISAKVYYVLDARVSWDMDPEALIHTPQEVLTDSHAAMSIHTPDLEVWINREMCFTLDDKHCLTSGVQSVISTAYANISEAVGDLVWNTAEIRMGRFYAKRSDRRQRNRLVEKLDGLARGYLE